MGSQKLGCGRGEAFSAAARCLQPGASSLSHGIHSYFQSPSSPQAALYRLSHVAAYPAGGHFACLEKAEMSDNR